MPAATQRVNAMYGKKLQREWAPLSPIERDEFEDLPLSITRPPIVYTTVVSSPAFNQQGLVAHVHMPASSFVVLGEALHQPVQITSAYMIVPSPIRSVKFLNLASKDMLTLAGYQGLNFSLFKRTDSSTQEDLVEHKEAQVQELIFRIRSSRFIRHCERLANRLVTLFNDAKEEDSACPGISIESLRNFYNFLQLQPDLKYPSISLTPEHNIYASWRDGLDRIFSAHFLAGGDVRFVVFTPNPRHAGRQIRISGMATTDILMETVASYEVKTWILE